MNRSNLFLRSVKPMDGLLTGMLKQCQIATLRYFRPNIVDGREAFSIINHHLIPHLDANKNVSYQILGSEMILLKNYISLMSQVGLVNICERWGVGPGGFYEPCNRYGHIIGLRMMCLGRNWDPVTRYGKRCRGDGSETPPLPYQLADFAEAAIKDAQAHLPELPSMYPDVCVINFYGCGDRLGLHQDRDESPDSLSSGLPVVSISLGNTAEFWYGHTRDENALSKVRLESGDVLIFGGKSRLIFHGIKEVIPNAGLWPLFYATGLIGGRLNLTLRKF